MTEMTEKRCPHCRRTLPLAEFNRDRSKSGGRRWCCRDCEGAYRRAHRQKRNAANVVYYAAHQEEYRAYRIAHHEERLLSARLYRASYPERRRISNKAYHDAHPERSGINNAKRRARLQGATIGDAKGLRLAYNSIRTTPRLRCYWCQEPVPVGERHADHIAPLAKGGAHAAWNLVCSCARCNNSKGAKFPAEFVGQGELAFA